MDYRRKVAMVAELLAQAKPHYLRALAWELRDRLDQGPPLTKQEALGLLRRAERAAAIATAWEVTRRR